MHDLGVLVVKSSTEGVKGHAVAVVAVAFDCAICWKSVGLGRFGNRLVANGPMAL
jgi:hypothetical protein